MTKAYMCDTFKHFKSGQCADCGQDNEKCVSIGIDVFDYRLKGKNVPNSVGKKYFIITDKEKPLFSE